MNEEIYMLPATPPEPTEQTPQQYVNTQPVLDTINETGNSKKYGPQLEELVNLYTLFLRQQSTSEQDNRRGKIERRLNKMFGRYGVHRLTEAYLYHSIRRDQTYATYKETDEIIAALPSRCRLPGNSPTSS